MASEQARFIRPTGTIEMAAGADVVSGEVILTEDATRAGVVMGLAGADSGDQIAVATTGIFELANDGNAVVAGALLDWDNTNNECVATTTGDFHVGRAIAASTASDTLVEVDLNVPNN